MKRNLFCVILLTMIAVSVLLAVSLTGCDDGAGPTETVADTEGSADVRTDAPSDTAANTVAPSDPLPTEPQNTDAVTEPDGVQTATDTADETLPETLGEATEPETDGQSEFIKKVIGASEEKGIYSFGLTLSDKAPEKGTLEYIYYGQKDTGEENVIICTYTANYYKDGAGLYDVMCYYDGNIDVHQSNKSEVKVVCTFGALTRAGSVIVFMTPDGGEKTQIFEAGYERFLPASD